MSDEFIVAIEAVEGRSRKIVKGIVNVEREILQPLGITPDHVRHTIQPLRSDPALLYKVYRRMSIIGTLLSQASLLIASHDRKGRNRVPGCQEEDVSTVSVEEMCAIIMY